MQVGLNISNSMSIDRAKTKIVNQIIEQIKEALEDPVEEKDSTDGLGDTIKEIFQPILDEFKELIGENEDKKSFIGALIKIFTILLSSRITTLTKIIKVMLVRTKVALDSWPKLTKEDLGSQHLLLHQARELKMRAFWTEDNQDLK